ncbi:MAG: ferritin-like domain-containing protein [Pseudomonadota bacterium]
MGLIKTRLNQAAKAELVTHQAYRKLRRQALPDLSGLQTLIERADLEDSRHYEQILADLERLNKHTDADPAPVTPIFEPMYIPDSVPEILDRLRQVELSLIRAYKQICTLSLDLDYRVFDLAFRNLQDNSIHLSTIDRMLAAVGAPATQATTGLEAGQDGP